MNNLNLTNVSLRSESRLTERSQTTIPAAIRDALHLKPGEYIKYELLPSGQVVISRRDEEESDPVIESFLVFLAQDMQKNPQNLKPLDATVWAHAKELTAGMDVDIDAELTDDD